MNIFTDKQFNVNGVLVEYDGYRELKEGEYFLTMNGDIHVATRDGVGMYLVFTPVKKTVTTFDGREWEYTQRGGDIPTGTLTLNIYGEEAYDVARSAYPCDNTPSNHYVLKQ